MEHRRNPHGTPFEKLSWYRKLMKLRFASRQYHRSYLSQLLQIDSEMEKLERTRTMRDLLLDALQPYFLGIAALLIFCITFLCMARVGTTELTADLYLKRVQMKVYDSLYLQPPKGDMKTNGFLSLSACDILGVGKGPGNFLIKPDSGTSISLSEIAMPKGTIVTIEQPFVGAVNLSATNMKNTMEPFVVLKGSATSASIYQGDSIIAKLKDGASISGGVFIVTKKLNDPEIFHLSIDSVRKFSLKDFSATDFSFSILDKKYDAEISTIAGGVIRLRGNKSDSLILNDGDQLHLHFTDPIRVKLDREEKGLHLIISGTASTYLIAPANGKMRNQMPKWFYVTFWDSSFFWSLIATIVPVGVAYLFRQRR
jgi:hypothetical protein